jgi:hypothetical protein
MMTPRKGASRLFPGKTWEPAAAFARPVPEAGSTGSPSSRQVFRGGRLQSFSFDQLIDGGLRYTAERPTLIRWNGWAPGATTPTIGYDFGTVAFVVASDASGGLGAALPTFGNYVWLPAAGTYVISACFLREPYTEYTGDSQVLATVWEGIDQSIVPMVLSPNGPASSIGLSKITLAAGILVPLDTSLATRLVTGLTSSTGGTPTVQDYGAAFWVNGWTFANTGGNVMQVHVGSIPADLTGGLNVAIRANLQLTANQCSPFSSIYLFSAAGTTCAPVISLRG